jgi:Fe-S-cluster containining protein
MTFESPLDMRLRAAENVLSSVDEIVTKVSKLHGRKIRCRVGCAMCCVQDVGVTLAEAEYVASFVERLPKAERDSLVSKVHEAAAERMLFTDNIARAKARMPCPFLTEGQTCAVYAARPVACRTYHSLSRNACAKYEDGRRPMLGVLEDLSWKATLMLFEASEGEGTEMSVLLSWIFKGRKGPMPDVVMRG